MTKIRKRNQHMNLDILDISYHRNGIDGIPFHAALFHDGNSLKIGVVFETALHCAVLDLELLLEKDIAFGSNSWRGDQYEPLLRDAISNRFGTE
jgi:hypothetical protein